MHQMCDVCGARRVSDAYVGYASAQMYPRRGALTAMSISAALRGMANARYTLARYYRGDRSVAARADFLAVRASSLKTVDGYHLRRRAV